MKYPDGLLPNVLALSYAALAYALGLVAITADFLVINFLGAILLAHGMVIAAYLVHECAHNTIFRDSKHNARLGGALNWLTGACYGDYERIRDKHFRHHIENADVVAFDYRPRLERYPALLRLLQVLEWLYIPAVEIIMHALVLVLPFTLQGRAHLRRRVISVLLIRGGVFALLVWYAPQVLFFYPLAYLMFLTVMRFMDVHQHTYDVSETLEEKRRAPATDEGYEQRNTFSNLFSSKHPWLNLLVLNFGYHNAHHLKPAMPWYRLPELHREKIGEDSEQILPFVNLLRSYHQYRVPRILNGDPSDSDVAQKHGVGFIGVDGVSFLTAH